MTACLTWEKAWRSTGIGPQNQLCVMECVRYRPLLCLFGNFTLPGSPEFLTGTSLRNNGLLYPTRSITLWFSWFAHWACELQNVHVDFEQWLGQVDPRKRPVNHALWGTKKRQQKRPHENHYVCVEHEFCIELLNLPPQTSKMSWNCLALAHYIGCVA
jgi:hypothetical protein